MADGSPLDGMQRSWENGVVLQIWAAVSSFLYCSPREPFPPFLFLCKTSGPASLLLSILLSSLLYQPRAFTLFPKPLPSVFPKYAFLPCMSSVTDGSSPHVSCPAPFLFWFLPCHLCSFPSLVCSFHAFMCSLMAGRADVARNYMHAGADLLRRCCMHWCYESGAMPVVMPVWMEMAGRGLHQH